MPTPAPTPPADSPRRSAQLRDLQYQRTLLDEERTYSSWARTGVSSVAADLALAKLLPHVEPAWVVRLVGAVTTVAGALSIGVGYCGFLHGRRHWQGDLPRAVPMWSVTALTALLIVGAALALCLIAIE